MTVKDESDYLREWREDKRTQEAVGSLGDLMDGMVKTAMGGKRGAERDYLLDKASGIGDAINHIENYGKES